MELRTHQLSNYVLVLVILTSSSNAAKGKSSLLLISLRHGVIYKHMWFVLQLVFLEFRNCSFFLLICIFQFKSLMLVVKLSAEAQIEEWLTLNLRFTNSPTSTSPTLVRIMFLKAASVGLLVSTYHHVSPLTWLYSPISWPEKSYVSCFHLIFTTTPNNSSQASFIIIIASR